MTPSLKQLLRQVRAWVSLLVCGAATALGREPLPPGDKAVAAWLETAARPLPAGEGASEASAWAFLDALLQGRRIVAMGEATHGTHEFFQVKHAVFRHLVETQGFTRLGIEMSYVEALPLNRYVLTGDGDPEALLAASRLWPWRTQEMLELIRWLQQYNQRVPAEKQVQVFGFDSGNGLVLGFPALERYFATHDPEFLPQLRTTAELFNTEAVRDRRKADAALNALQARLEKPPSSPRTESQARPWREALRTLRVMRQNLEYYDAQVVYLVRDRHMAQNVATELEETGPRGKIFLWAHNAHVSRASRFQGAESTAAWKRVRSMGHHLAQRFGAQLFVMGFEFNEGAFQLPGSRAEDGSVLELQEAVLPPAPEGTLAAALATAGLENAFIRLTPPADGDVRRWLGRPVQVHDYGGGALDEERSLVPIPLLESYDALVFIRRTSRARPLAPRGAVLPRHPD